MSDYEIRPGDTLSKIAKKYGVTVKQLQEANGIKNPNLIFAGKNLKIPIEQDEAFDIPGLKIDKTDPTTPVKTLYGIPTPSGSTPTTPTMSTTPTLPSSVRTLYGVPTPSGSKTTPTIPSGEVRALYAHITPIEPSASDLPKIYPTDGGKAIPLYGVPTPSGSKTTPTVPSGEVRALYAHITPSEPSASDLPKIYPTDGGKAIPLYGVPTPSGSKTTPTVPSGEVRALYAHITPKEPSGVELPKITPTGGGKMIPLYGIVTPSGSDTTVTPKPTVPVKVPTPAKTKPLTDAEKKAADSMGKNVAHYLAGYTMDVEQEAIVNNVNKVNNRNVLEFLQSYTNHRNDEIVHAEPFFTQTIKEYGFDEKQDVMHKVALRLAAKLANDGKTKDATAVKNILKHAEFTKDDAKALDSIYTKYIN